VSSVFRVNLVRFLWKNRFVSWLCYCSVPLSDFAKIQVFLFWLTEPQHVFLSLIVTSCCLVVFRCCEGGRSLFRSGFCSSLTTRLAHAHVW
jgi:hypothetical protein